MRSKQCRQGIIGLEVQVAGKSGCSEASSSYNTAVELLAPATEQL